MEGDCLEGDRSRGLLRWPVRLRLRSGASAAAGTGARTGAMTVRIGVKNAVLSAERGGGS